ncbi:MAG TPA: hypothetical protein VH482_32345 [Thermomicrobiales bacterium]|jgi:hypothetical protein
MGNFLVMEYHALDVHWWSDLVDGDPPITQGFIHLTDDRGHGLTLDEDVASAFTTAVEFLRSDPIRRVPVAMTQVRCSSSPSSTDARSSRDLAALR